MKKKRRTLVTVTIPMFRVKRIKKGIKRHKQVNRQFIQEADAGVASIRFYGRKTGSEFNTNLNLKTLECTYKAAAILKKGVIIQNN